MQSQTASRKRPAPGTSPQTQTVPLNTYPAMPGTGDVSQLSNDEFLAWGANGGDISQSNFAPNNADGNMMRPGQVNNAAGQASSQLVRRNNNHHLSTRPRDFDEVDEEPWTGIGPLSANAWGLDQDTRELERKAAIAKRDALSKRPPKTIPPFIQKLSSFLDNNSNEDLIRWSDTGDSFIVLDEEKFANTLIPELFKHKNYASFVRQLNMYGFHKRVGLTDNSMRASERKAKTPSEYENAYFKRGRPDLLWLIAKPKPQSASKKKKSKFDEDESDDDAAKDEDAQEESGPGKKHLDLVTLPRSQLATFQSEIQQLKRSQQQINNMIARFQHENNQYIRQASQQHERHENSINAILQFLATFYSRSQDASGNLPNMFTGNIPSNQPQGNVRDLGDYEDLTPAPDNQLARRMRTPLALMPPPETRTSTTPEGSSPKQQSQSPPLRPNQQQRRGQSGLRNSVPQSTERTAESPKVKDSPSVQATDNLDTYPEINFSNSSANIPSNNDIMSVINNANAASPSNNDLDFSSALRHYENAGPNGPLTPEQRDNMLSLMANSTGASPNMSSALTGARDSTQSLWDQFGSNKEQLDLLQRLQQEQDSKVQDLAGRLQPLSPSGSIPGLHSSENALYSNPSSNDPVDLERYLNSDYFKDQPGEWNLNGDDLNFDAPGFDDLGDGGAANTTLDGQAPASQNDGLTSSNNDELFGGIDFDQAAGEGGEGDGDGEGEGEGEGAGRVIGSVGTSSGARSPEAEAEEEQDTGGPRKRQRRGA